MNEQRISRDFINRMINDAKFPIREIQPGDLDLEILHAKLTMWIGSQTGEKAFKNPADQVANRVISAIIQAKGKSLKRTIQSLRPAEIEPLMNDVIPKVGDKLTEALNAVLTEYQLSVKTSPTATVVIPRSNRK